MEAFAILFVIFIFYWLLQPEPKKKPKKPGDLLIDGLKAAYKEITGSSGGGDKKGGGGSGQDGVLRIVVISIVVGILFTYLL